MYRCVFIVLLPLLFLTQKAIAADHSTQTLMPDVYIREGNTGTLEIKASGAGKYSFSIDSIGANCHVCTISGVIQGNVARVADGDDICRVDFVKTPNGVEVKPENSDSFAGCRAYCGMRASFDGVYQSPPTACSKKNLQHRRNEFSKLYRAREFNKAGNQLQELLSQCANFIDWVTIDRIRNDLAVTQFHSGDAQACLKTLKSTRAASVSNEEALKDELPPCDFDNYLNVAKSTWHNKALCMKK